MKFWQSILLLVALLWVMEISAQWEPFPEVKQITRFPELIQLTGRLPVQQNLQAVDDYISRGLTRLAGKKVTNPLVLKLNPTFTPEEYELVIAQGNAVLAAGSPAGLWNGAALFLDYARSEDANFENEALNLPAVTIRDYPDLKLRGIDFQWCYVPPTLEMMKRTVQTMRALRMNTIVPEFGARLVWTSKNSVIPHETARAFLRECATNGLLVIPKVNCFGHSDRGFAWPKMLGKGLDFRAEENYAALDMEIAAWQKELKAAGLPMPYFHFGMDEASNCLLKNVEIYKAPADELMGIHMNRVAAIAERYNTAGIIYHDMLVGKEEPIYWREMGTSHIVGQCYKARKTLNRNLVINYWNYEAFNRYRTVEAIQKEGFKILFTPWGGTAVQTMAKNAKLYGEGLLGSTWCDFSVPKDGSIPRNSIFNRGWIRDGMVDCAKYGWNARPANEAQRPADGGVAWIDGVMDRKGRTSAAIPVVLTLGKAERVIYKGVPFAIGTPIRVGKTPMPDFDRIVELNLRNAAWPLQLIVNRKKAGEVRHFNQPESYRGLTLYTASYGRESGVDIYSTEVRIQNGVVWSQNDWGVGHTPIPRNGAVISTWGEAQAGLGILPVGAKLELRDANDKEVSLSPDNAVTVLPTTEIALNREADTLHFLHRSTMEGDLSAPEAVRAVLSFADGTMQERVFRYGRELAAPADRLLVNSEDAAVWVARADFEEVLYAYSWQLPEKKFIKSLRLEPVAGSPIGYELLALSLEKVLKK